jgi:hypothetical protein
MNTELKLEHVFDTTRYQRGPGDEPSGEQKKQRRQEPKIYRLDTDRVEISAEGRRAFEEAQRAPEASSVEVTEPGDGAEQGSGEA